MTVIEGKAVEQEHEPQNQVDAGLEDRQFAAVGGGYGVGRWDEPG